MADDEWQLKAVHEQFNVFECLRSSCEDIPSSNFITLMEKVADVKNSHTYTNRPSPSNPRAISAEIMKHSDGENVKLSFIVIVTNIEVNGKLCKMPIFVIISGGKKTFIDMNLTCFNSWKAFLVNNDLPPCKFCFPYEGQYNVGRHLKIDFASSPAAIREDTNVMWKTLAFFVGVGIVVGSFFFEIPPSWHSQADLLLRLAEDFVPSIRDYGRILLTGVTAVSKLKKGDLCNGLLEISTLLIHIRDKFGKEISCIFKKLKQALAKMYKWLCDLFSSLFKTASESEQHAFLAITSQVDTELISAEEEAEDLLEASWQNNRRALTTGVLTVMHAQVHTEQYANTIFGNARIESTLQSGKKLKDDVNLHSSTQKLLIISKNLANKLHKTEFKDTQDIFQALSNIVKEEFRNKIETYTKMLKAAKAGAGHPIDIDEFNKSLGIEGDLKEHYWREALTAAMNSRLIARINDKIKDLEGIKEPLILELGKEAEDGFDGLYRLVGVKGAGKCSANDIIKALKKKQVKLNDEMLVINETSSMTVIRENDITISVLQELNPENNTSDGIIWIVTTEV